MSHLFSTTVFTSLVLGGLFCFSSPIFSAEDGEEPVKKEKVMKAKMGYSSGTITAIDSAKKTITVRLESKGNNEENADENEAAQSINIICNEDTSIKSGKESVELASLVANSKVSVKYNMETKVASSIKVKKERKPKVKKEDKDEADDAEKQSDD